MTDTPPKRQLAVERSRNTAVCAHASILPGPTIPRVYGSGCTIVCADCGAWRPAWNEHVGWRPAATLEKRIEATW
jgi:hypothetical protein